MTAHVIDIFTRQPLPIPLAVSHWTPRTGERVDVLIPQMEGDAPARWPGVVRSGPVNGKWAVEFDHMPDRLTPVALAEMRPGDQPTGPEAA